MKLIISILSVLVMTINTVIAQQTYYSIHPSQLSIRSTPSDKADVIGKIAFGDSFITIGNDDYNPINLEGITTQWIKINYKGTIGYVIESYIFPIHIQEKKIDVLGDFLYKNFKTAGNEWKDVKTDKGIDGELTFTTTHTKQLFENGINYSNISGHEYIFESIDIPNINFYQAYNFLKLLTYYNQPLLQNHSLENGDYTFEGKNGIEYEISIQADSYQDHKYITHLKINWQDGSYNTIEITSLSDGVRISTASGN